MWSLYENYQIYYRQLPALWGIEGGLVGEDYFVSFIALPDTTLFNF